MRHLAGNVERLPDPPLTQGIVGKGDHRVAVALNLFTVERRHHQPALLPVLLAVHVKQPHAAPSPLDRRRRDALEDRVKPL
jgi:hypothetical protein